MIPPLICLASVLLHYFWDQIFPKSFQKTIRQEQGDAGPYGQQEIDRNDSQIKTESNSLVFVHSKAEPMMRIWVHLISWGGELKKY